MLAVLLYQYVANKPAGIPDVWPAEVRDVTELPGPDWVVMSYVELETYKQTHKATYDAWYQNTFSPMSQKEKDFNKYIKRARVKDTLMAEMASENMERVRNGMWTVLQLVELTQDPTLKLVLDDINTLSFELAQSKLQGATHNLLTTEIKLGWIVKLQNNLFNE
jgi:hypothetical protein